MNGEISEGTIDNFQLKVIKENTLFFFATMKEWLEQATKAKPKLANGVFARNTMLPPLVSLKEPPIGLLNEQIKLGLELGIEVVL